MGSYLTHVLHTARISSNERVLYNDTQKLLVRLLSHLLGSYETHVLHTARISNTETLMVRLLSHLLGFICNIRLDGIQAQDPTGC